MPLPTPILDDRSWQQLRDELVRRIPVYTPEWTDHNPSDPGITLLELFAFLGENLLFRFNQIPETTRLEFLRLLRVPLRPAQPSRALVAFTLSSATETLVPRGTETKAGSISFETQDELKVWPLGARAVGRLASAKPEEGSDAEIYAGVAINAREIDESAAAYYTTEVLAEDPTEPGFQALNFGATVDGMLWIAVLSTDDTQLARLSDGVINVGFIPDPVVLAMDEVDGCPGAGANAGTTEIVWEISTPVIAGDEPVYRALRVAGDTTRGLAQQGIVRLRLPGDVLDFGLPAVDEELAGTGDFPPVLDDEELAETLLFWIRAYPRQRERRLGSALWLGINAAEVLQVKSARTELLGSGTGGANQSYSLVHTPVVVGSLVLEVEEAGGWTPWLEVDDFAAARRDDRIFTVDPESGEVSFGDGTRGRVPQIGERIRAREYRYGGGSVGNVAARAITKVAGVAGVKASNPRPASGGADSEEIRDALERIPGELRRRDRAVTASDFRELALMTPGAGVGRAEVLPLFHPPTLLPNSAGVVTVVVWPQEDLVRPNAPMPDRDLLRRVCAYLDERRLVTTELYVVPPTYRQVAVSVGVRPRPGFGIEAVRAWVELVVRQYLAPLPPYGPAGGGWPLGRRVFGPELEAAALQVEGVEYLEGLHVAEKEVRADGTFEWVERTVILKPYEVVELVEITVVEGIPLPAGESLSPAPILGGNGEPQLPVPIPTLKEEC